MQNVKALWLNLDMRARIIAGLAAVGVFVLILALVRAPNGKDMALLYAGLDGTAGGAVVAALEQQATPYEVRQDAIWVPAGERDRLRLLLAAEGLPEAGTQGYELLDSLNGFGTTAQVFDAAYWRAKEGELARTILAAPGVRQARVHISVPVNRPFARATQVTAAVTVTTTGQALGGDQARALRYLVAAAVPGLLPTDVAVIDTLHGLIGGDEARQGSNPLAEDLRQRAMRLLEARVGPGNAMVEVSIDSITESETIVERRIDPESRTIIATALEEREAQSQGNAAGAVSVASNLPDGDAAANGADQRSTDTETRATTNYDLSETSREVQRAPGGIRRMSVAVLVNDIVTTAPDGSRSLTPRTETEVDALRALVASAVGLDEGRGDVITMRAMAFEPVSDLGSEAVLPAPPRDLFTYAKIGALALVAMILGLFVIRPIVMAGRNPPPMLDLPAPTDPAPPLPAMIAQPDPVTRLRQMIEARQDETIQILQEWIDEPARKERS